MLFRFNKNSLGNKWSEVQEQVLKHSLSTSTSTKYNESGRETINQSINQKAFIVSSTVIKIHSNYGNIRHNRNKWKQKAYRYTCSLSQILI